MNLSWTFLLLLLCGDIESNPGPPKRGAPRGAPAKDDKKEVVSEGSQLEKLESKVEEWESKVKDQEEQLGKLQKAKDSQHQEIEELKATIVQLMGFDQKVNSLTQKVDAITGVYEDINEKMFEIDKTRKNNLLFYGIKPDFLPEIQSQLEKKVHEIMRFSLHLNRSIPVVKIARMMTGPEVRGCRPVLINYAYWKDREEVLSKSRLLRGSNIYITEDLSRRMRETRHHLTKYMREVRSKSPTKKCVIRYDKLYIDNTPYSWDEERREIVRYFAPEARPASRNNYSSLGDSYYSSSGGSAGLVRSTSFPSVNGMGDDGEFRSSSRGSGINSVLGSQIGGSRADFASTGNLHLGRSGTPNQDEQGGYNNNCISPSPIPMIEEGVNEIESPRKPLYGESPGRRIMRNGVEIPTLDTGDDDRLNSPSPRAPIRTDAEVSPLQLTKKDKGKQRQEKLQEEKDAAENQGATDSQPSKESDQSSKGENIPSNNVDTAKPETAFKAAVETAFKTDFNEVNETST